MTCFSPKTIAVVLVFTLGTTVAVSKLSLANRVEAPVSRNNPGTQQPAPAGWRKFDARGKFSFYLPPNMWQTGVQGIENYHSEYTNGRIHLSFDYDAPFHLAYENRVTAYGKDFQETELLIDGRKSYLFVYEDLDRKKRKMFNADLHVGDLPNGDVILHMWANCTSPRGVETAKTIFQTIKFP